MSGPRNARLAPSWNIAPSRQGAASEQTPPPVTHRCTIVRPGYGYGAGPAVARRPRHRCARGAMAGRALVRPGAGQDTLGSRAGHQECRLLAGHSRPHRADHRADAPPVRWLDVGANGQAMQSITRAVNETNAGDGGLARAWSGTQPARPECREYARRRRYSNTVNPNRVRFIVGVRSGLAKRITVLNRSKSMAHTCRLGA